MTRLALVVAAHADDETLGCGATVGWLADRGWTVDVVIVTDGLVRRGDRLDDNRADAARACAALGAGEPTFLGFGDQELDTVPLKNVAGALAALDLVPEVLITHDESDLNSDHSLTAAAVQVAFRPGASGAAPSVLAMEIPGSTSRSRHPFAADYYVDVVTTFDRKLAALACYANELREPPHPRSIHGVTVAAGYHGLHAGCRLAEGFRLVRGVAGSMP